MIHVKPRVAVRTDRRGGVQRPLLSPVCILPSDHPPQRPRGAAWRTEMIGLAVEPRQVRTRAAERLANRILEGLQEIEGEETAPEQSARLGFLEWILSLPAGASAQRAARNDLARLKCPNRPSPAVCAFIDLLIETARGGAIDPGTARRCHGTSQTPELRKQKPRKQKKRRRREGASPFLYRRTRGRSAPVRNVSGVRQHPREEEKGAAGPCHERSKGGEDPSIPVGS